MVCSVVFHYALICISLCAVSFSRVGALCCYVLLFSAWIGFAAVATLCCSDVFYCVLLDRDVLCWVPRGRILKMCFPLLYSALICSVVLCFALFCCALLSSTTLYSILLCSVQPSSALFCFVLPSSVLCYAFDLNSSSSHY
jgi:hypothetical protein